MLFHHATANQKKILPSKVETRKLITRKLQDRQKRPLQGL